MANPLRPSRSSSATIFPAMQTGDFEKIIFLQDRRTGLRSIVCIHSTRLGPAHDGVRRIPYRSESDALADVMRLAHAMSRRAALAGIPSGGGKAVIIDRPGLNRRGAYEALGRFIECLGGQFCTGSDVGTAERDLASVRRHTRFVVERQKTQRPGNIARAAADGVIAAIRATLRFLYGDWLPAGYRFAVQGLGAIGERVARWLWSSGAGLTLAEIDPSKLERWRGRARVWTASPGRIVPIL